MDPKKSKNELLQEKIVLDKKSSWLNFSDKEKKEIFEFSDDYKEFLNNSKTERRCIQTVIAHLEKNGFKNIEKINSAKTGDKIYKNVKDKALFAAVLGENLDQFHLIGSHVDSPRLDLKPHPFFEDSDLALMKTHYYGGVKKYHWVNTPLCLQGIIHTKENKKIILSIGESEDEPKFIIPDLLPHLAKMQMEKKASQIVEGEELNILVGNIPIGDEKIKEKVKFTVLNYLYEKYKLIEEDFLCAELELVPAGKAVEIGFDRSLIASYGQDDKVCVYTSLRALLDLSKSNSKPKQTAVAFFSDKEEIGSCGDTGAEGLILENFANDYAQLVKLKINVSELLEKSKAISADVTAGVDPNYKDVQDLRNASYLSYGVSVEKYGGGGGKYGTHDATAEYMNYIRLLLDKNKIAWQAGELGKIDLGGGGTIGVYLSKYGMDCVDIGPCVLAMHSPYEVASKADIYSAYLIYKVFYKD